MTQIKKPICSHCRCEVDFVNVDKYHRTYPLCNKCWTDKEIYEQTKNLNIYIDDIDDILTISEWVNFLFNGDSDDIDYIKKTYIGKYQEIKKKYHWKFVGMNQMEVLEQLKNGVQLS